ncbi:hypothetical protein QE370_000740 [Aeromicrobium sp. SORGH_AS981]|jgi:hypothetical protein|nr:hypothetical protein [Aeromicrobium sp. SORGH_AS_0981]
MRRTWRRWRCRLKYGYACPHLELHTREGRKGLGTRKR